jgi:hypothetical protein
VSGHFGFQIISGQVGPNIGLFRVSDRIRSGWIGSSSVGSFRVSGSIRSGRDRYWVVQCRVISGYGSYRVRASRAGFSGQVVFCHL